MQNVGNRSQLTPGATYIYERDGKNVYAREHGSTDRILIGSDYEPGELKVFGMPGGTVARWVDILRAAEHIPALQEALDRAKVIYELSKQEQTVDHHPV